ncbi:MAG: hypothetical protein WCH65_09240 [bacterium]
MILAFLFPLIYPSFSIAANFAVSAGAVAVAVVSAVVSVGAVAVVSVAVH